MNKDVLHLGIDLLSRREHSTKELRQKMQQRGHASDDINKVIEFLVENDYCNEIRFTESVFRSRLNKGYGYRYIEQELLQKGIDGNTISVVKDELDIDWFERAAAAYEKNLVNLPLKMKKRELSVFVFCNIVDFILTIFLR